MILNMVRGGGGSLKATDAVLIVTVPTSSTVTATKNGVTLIPKMWVQNADNTLNSAIFSISSNTFDANAWTVAATLNGNFTSKEIVINSNKEYSLELSPKVPIEYQAVEYLQSSKTQYILTGIIQTNTRWGFEIDFMTPDSFNNSTYGAIFGKRTSSSVNEFQLTTYTDNTTGGTLRMGATSYSPYLSRNVRQFCMKHGLVYTNPNNGTITVANTTLSNQELCVFALNNNGSIVQHGSPAIYSLKLFDDNDNLVADYQPCYRRLDSVAGFYDQVSQTFLTNSGTGTFIVGADI